MKLGTYKGYIIDRFMDKRQQAEFDKQYEDSKVIKVGRKEIDKRNK